MNARLRRLIVVCAVCLLASCGGESLECGANTEEVDGRCINPAPDTCEPGTAVDADGNCVAEEMTPCGSGTERDANSGECVPTDAVCGENTAFDEAIGFCVPTSSVCAPGTTFDDALGVCTSESVCRPDDVLLHGICVPSGVARAADPDAVSEENDDPAFGGTPTPIELPPVGEQFVFAGVIDEPRDLDGDGRLDQDVDVFTFEATSGQWVTLSLEPLGAPSLGYVVAGPPGSQFERYSPLGSDVIVERTFVTTVPGIYAIRVVPAAILLDPTVGPVGGDDFEYVGSLEVREGPQPTPVNLASGAMATLGEPADNFFADPGFLPESFGQLQLEEWAPDSIADISFWHGEQFLASRVVTNTARFSVIVPDTGQITFLVDAVRVDSQTAGYAISGTQGGQVSPLGEIAPDTSVESSPTALQAFENRFYSLRAEAGQVLEFSQDNAEGAPVSLELLDAAGKSFQDTSLEARSTAFGSVWTYMPARTGGTFMVRARAGGTRTDFRLQVSSYTPVDLGEVAPGERETAVVELLPPDRSHFVTVSLAAADVTEISQSNATGARASVVVYEDDWRQPQSFDLADRSSASVPRYRYAYDLSDMTLVEIHNETAGDISQIDVRFATQNPQDLGTLSPGDVVAESDSAPLAATKSIFYTATFVETVTLDGYASAASGDVDFVVRERNGTPVLQATTTGNETFEESIGPGRFLLELEAVLNLTAGWSFGFDVRD